jgi:hypothetical protein
MYTKEYIEKYLAETIPMLTKVERLRFYKRKNTFVEVICARLHKGDAFRTHIEGEYKANLENTKSILRELWAKTDFKV